MRRRIWAVVGCDTSSVFDSSTEEHQGTDIGGSGGNGIAIDSSTTLGGGRKDKRAPIPRSVCNGNEKVEKMMVSNERQLCITVLNCVRMVCLLTIRGPITTGQ